LPLISNDFQIKTIDSMLFGKLRHDAADTPKAETGSNVDALLNTRSLLLQGIDCVIPKYAAEPYPPCPPSFAYATVPTTACALLTWDSSPWRSQHDDAAPFIRSKKASDAGAAPPKTANNAGVVVISPSFDAGAVVDAILHDTAHLQCPPTCPPSATDGQSFHDPPTARWSVVDPFHGDWPHW
jgi:hypothetical protein